jgi:hypothetical protein
MKFVVGALAAVTLLVGVAASQPAEARCFWNGFAWQCWHHPHHYWGGWRHHHHRAYGWY